jgi:rhodanese-related sulfurtransferase
MNNELVKMEIVRHGQSCTNIMTHAYSLLIEDQNPYDYYNGKLGPPMNPLWGNVWRRLGRISQDPPLNNGGLCELIDLHETHFKDKAVPYRVYCSSMCRAMMTAMILYPNGGEDGKIHVCPWIHEIPSSAGGLLGEIEAMATKKGRSPRDFDELKSLVDKINNSYRLGSDKHISLGDGLKNMTEIIGNKYTAEKLFNHSINAKLKFISNLEENYNDDVNFEEFIDSIVKPAIKGSNNKEISVVCHGYTMRAGCREGQPHPGVCKYLKLMNDDIDDKCFKPESFTNGKSDSKCMNKYLKLIKSGKNIPNGGVISFDLTEKGVEEIDFNAYSVKSTEHMLDEIYKYHNNSENWTKRSKERDIFKESIKCLLRNLLYPWRYYAVKKSNNKEQRDILENGWNNDNNNGYCNPEIFINSNAEWFLSSMRMNPSESRMFDPYLPLMSIGRSMRRVSKKKSRKKKPKKKASKKKKPKKKDNKRKRTRRRSFK